MQSLNVLTASAMQQFRTSIGRPMFRFCVLAQPMIFGLLLGMMYLEKSDMDFTLYAVFGSGLSTFWSSICFSSASDIHRERWYGTLETIYAAPAGFKWIVLGKIIGNSIWGFLSICISFSMVTLVFQKQIVINNYLWLAIGLVFMTLSLVAIGYLFAALFTLSRNARVLMNFMEYPVYILCGILFPIEQLPVFLRYVSYVFSPTWAVKIIHYAVWGGTWHEVSPYIGGLLILTLCYFLISVIMFGRIDAKCRIDATLEVY